MYLNIIPITNLLINELQIVVHSTNDSSSSGFQSVNLYCKMTSYLINVYKYSSIRLNNKRIKRVFSLMDFETCFKPSNWCCLK